MTDETVTPEPCEAGCIMICDACQLQATKRALEAVQAERDAIQEQLGETVEQWNAACHERDKAMERAEKAEDLLSDCEVCPRPITVDDPPVHTTCFVKEQGRNRRLADDLRRVREAIMSVDHKNFWTTIQSWKRGDTPGDGCVIWSGYSRNQRYGDIRLDGRMHKVHRLVYSMVYGSIPDGRVVCHTCDTPRCINPTHLFIGTQADNLRDARDKGRRPTNRRHGLTKNQVERVLRSPLSATYFSRKFGVPARVITQVRREANA